MSINSRGRKTRTEVLDAAWDLVSDQGAEVSVSQIAEAVGISRQTIYMHFGTRGGLLVALVRRADERFEIKEQFDAALELADARTRLTATLQAWLTFVPKIFPVASDLIRLREKDQEANAAWEDRMTDLRDWLLVLMRSLRADDVLKDHWTPEQAGHLFWAQTSVQIWGLLRFECGWSEDAIVEKLQQSLADCLLKSGDPAAAA